MFRSHRTEAKREPVLEHLIHIRSNRCARGDLYTAWVNSQESIFDITTVDPLNKSNLKKLDESSNQVLERAEDAKNRTQINDWNLIDGASVRLLYFSHLLCLFMVGYQPIFGKCLMILKF
ncbi:hypothetical protein RCL1_001323 [Eukaryota sp. TZLM3-RCL]